MTSGPIALVEADAAERAEAYALVIDTVAEKLRVERGLEPLAARAAAAESCQRAIEECGERSGVLCIVEANGERAGYVWTVERQAPEPRSMHVLFLFTFPDKRRRGIARSTLSELRRVARQQGHTAITLVVASSNPGAARLYREVGFVPFPGGMILRLSTS